MNERYQLRMEFGVRLSLREAGGDGAMTGRIDEEVREQRYEMTVRYDHMIESVEQARELFRGAHYIDIKVRKNGRDFRLEGDWLKKLRPVEEAGE